MIRESRFRHPQAIAPYIASLLHPAASYERLNRKRAESEIPTKDNLVHVKVRYLIEYGV